MSKRKTNLLFGLAVLLCVVSLGATLLYAYDKQTTGVEFVKAAYDFDLNTINSNDDRIKELSTPEVYNQTTLSSNNRQMRVYLKFKGDRTRVNIIRQRNQQIIYSIDNPNIDPNRTFALEYEYSWGKITKVVEYEIFFLPPGSRDDL